MTDPRREVSGEEDLSEEDRRLLQHLRESARRKDVVEPEEDRPEVGESTQDDCTLDPEPRPGTGESDAR